MMSKELINRLIKFYESCENHYGKMLLIDEAISTNKDNFDRHFTSFSNLEFELKNFGVRFSGARAMFLGEKQSYEIGSDWIIQFSEKENNEYIFIEKYSEKVYRKSVLKFVDHKK